MAEILSLENLEKEHFKALTQFRAKVKVADMLIKAGDLLLGKSYLRDAFLLNQKVSLMGKQLKAIKTAFSNQ